MKNKCLVNILIATIVLLLVLGGLYWYVDKNKQGNNRSDLDENINTNQENNNLSDSNKPTTETLNTLKTDKLFSWAHLYTVKYNNDVFITTISGMQQDYSGVVYHLDLNKNTLKLLDTPYLYKENNKLYGLKMYKVFSVEDITSSESEKIIEQKRMQRLNEIANEVGISKDKLKIIGVGGLPMEYAIVKTEYDPRTQSFKLLPNEEAFFPSFVGFVNDQWDWTINKIKYPTIDFVNLGLVKDIAENPMKIFGIEFKYDLATEILSLTY